MNASFFARRQNRRSAYILLEVMLATAIFAMVATALAISLNETIEAALRIRRVTNVVLNLESRMAEARQSPLTLGKESSKRDADGIVYEKEVSLLEMKNRKNQPLTGLYNLKISARWKEQNQEMTRVAQTYVLHQ